MKKIDSPDPKSYVYISLHALEDVPFERSLGKVNKFMADSFGGVGKPAYTSVPQREIIYQLDKPMEAGAMRKFFEDLSSLFIALAAYSPHFTHYHEGGGNTNG